MGRPAPPCPGAVGLTRERGSLTDVNRVLQRATPALGVAGWLAAVALTWRYVWVGWTGRMDFLAAKPYVNKGMSDFRDTGILPNLALDRGINPYDLVAYHDFAPHAQYFNPYAPWWLSVTRPLSSFAWDQATLMWACVLGALVVLAGVVGGRELASRFSVAWWVTVPWCVVLLWLWRPVALANGLGNIGAVVAIAAGLSLIVRSRWLGALLVAVAWIKPQYGIPLAVIMMIIPSLRFRYLIGTSLAIVASLPEVVRLADAAGGVSPLLSSVVNNALAVGDESAVDLMAGRIDLGGLFAAFGWFPGSALPMGMGVLAIAATAVWMRPAKQVSHRAGFLLAAVLLIGFPHFHYDLSVLVLLAPGAVAEAWRTPRSAPAGRWLWTATVGLVAALCLVPGSLLPYAVMDSLYLIAAWVAFIGALASSLVAPVGDSLEPLPT